MKILAFDIGGSKISSVLIDENGIFLSAVKRVPTPRLVEEIKMLLQKNIAVDKPEGVAIATAGVVHHNRVAFKPNNLPEGYEHIDFSTLIKVPYIIENDANAAAWAEYKLGALQHTENSLMMTLGTGVGCGIICDKKLLHGKSGTAGEVDFPLSGRDLAKLAAENNLSESDCFAIKHAADSGNMNARRVLTLWNNELISALSGLNKLLDVEVVALSGSLASIVDYETIEQAVNLQASYNPLKLVPAQFENNAGLIGAALLWQERYRS